MKLFTSAIQWQWLLSLLLLFLSLTTCDAFSRPHKIPRLTPLYKSILQRSSSKTQLLPPDFRTFYYTQTLDHFNYATQSYATFQQRYIVNFKYSSGAQSNSLIFAWLGAKAPIDSNPRAIEFLTDNAPGFKALLVYIEEVSGTCYRLLTQLLPCQTASPFLVASSIFVTFIMWALMFRDLNLVSELKDYLDGMYCAAAQYDSPAQQPVRVVCGGIDGAPKGVDILDRIHAGVVAIKGNKPAILFPL
nr:Peptidase S28 [Ipomoea trifida]